jgi:hypothetical protein
MAKHRMTSVQYRLHKAVDRLNAEGDKWAVVLYSALALALRRNHGHAKKRVTDLVNVTWDAWLECAKDNDCSMIKKCDMELGIEIQNGSGVSYKDVAYLNGEDIGDMTLEQILYMRSQQIKWVRPNIMACILIAMHRKHKYGYDRCVRLLEEIEDIEHEYKSNPKSLARAAQDEVGIDVRKMIFEKREVEDGPDQ